MLAVLIRENSGTNRGGCVIIFFTAKSPRKISFQTGKIEVVIFFCAAARESFGEGFVQSCKRAKFLDLNTVPRVCPWRSWRLGVLAFLNSSPLSRFFQARIPEIKMLADFIRGNSV